MRLRRTAALSIRALLAHRVRALLALLSVSTGVASVLVTSAIGSGASGDVRRRIESMGSNLLVVRPAQVKRLVARRRISGAATTLALDDYEAILAIPSVLSAAPGADGASLVKSDALAMMTTVRGTTPEFPHVRRVRVASGRFFDKDDDRAARRVAVLGARVAATLFAGESALGRDVRIRGVPFEVVGVLESKGVMTDGSDDDNQALVPIRTAMRRVFNSTWLDTIFVSATDAAAMDRAESDIRRLLRGRHRPAAGAAGRDDFEIQNTARMMAIQQQAAQWLTRLSAALGGLSLLVGGSGILALMLLSVKERTVEIGLRIAVGAKPRDILVQFLLEATALALGGWMVGVALGALGAAAVAYGTEWLVAVPTGALLASAAMAVAIGLGFGALPARRASRIPPIQALLSR